MERDRSGGGAFGAAEEYYYQQDGLGSVRALLDRTGAVVERYQYDSFGNLIAPAGSAAKPSQYGNPYFFTGREWDGEIGLYYYRARHYDASFGRFLQVDPVWRPARPDALNRYVYVANNPVNATDPSGLDWWDDFLDILKSIGINFATKDSPIPLPISSKEDIQGSTDFAYQVTRDRITKEGQYVDSINPDPEIQALITDIERIDAKNVTVGEKAVLLNHLLEEKRDVVLRCKGKGN